MKPPFPYGLLLLTIYLLMQACVRQFEPEFTEYENILVVNGILTNEHMVHTISLSRSYPLDKRNSLPETGARVSLVNESGNEWKLTEFPDGQYKTDTNNMVVSTGDKYKLHIITKNGEEFESDVEEILPVPDIDSLTWKFKERVSIDDGSVTQGVEFFIDTHDPLGKTRYYQWELCETWEFRVPFVAENSLPNRTTCWKDDNPQEINIASSEFLVEDRLTKHPLYFLTGVSNRLAIHYSLQVKQHVLQKESYNYLDQLKKINYQQGSLYDTPPAQIQSNIRNLTHPDKPVLGYFLASGVSTRRIFIERDELPADFYISGGYPNCTILEVPEVDAGSYYAQGYVFVSLYYNTQMHGWYAVITNSVSCIDCTVNGSNTKPAYWPK